MTNSQKSAKDMLLKLKEWLTVPESAKYLSMMFKEDVVEADILRFVLEGHLKISVNFLHKAHGRYGKVVKDEKKSDNIEHVDRGEGSYLVCSADMPDYAERLAQSRPKYRQFFDQLDRKKIVIDKLDLGDGRTLQLEKEIKAVEGLWDLLLTGGGMDEIQRRYVELMGLSKLDFWSFQGILLERDGELCQLQERFDDSEFIPGSDAQLERLKEIIAIANLDEETSVELMTEHQKRRQEYLAARGLDNSDDTYCPTDQLPKDSILVIPTKELVELQNKLSQEGGESDINVPIFDKKHPFHAKELMIAVEAWTDIYERNPPKGAPHGGHLQHIKNWLKEHYPGLSIRSRERISTVINPNPKGGASPT